MNTCTDKRYQQLIHAYELDMLPEDQRRKFESHLLECDACFEEVQGFQEATRLMNRDAEVRNLAARIDAEKISDAKGVRAGRSRVTLPLSLAAAAILVILVLRPWNIEIRPTQEAVAAEDRLLVLSFTDPTDRTDSSSLTFVAANLLIADLTQHGVNVVSSMRLYDIARALGHSDPTQLDWGLAHEVATRSRANWILLGTILSPPPEPVISAELVEASSGDIAATFRIAALEGEGMYDVVGRLSGQIGAHLASRMDVVRDGSSVAQITSPSLDAYRLYLRGVDEMEKLHNDRAVASFQRALELDPEMPMAYYYLARLLDRPLIEKAVEHLDRASREEQSYIRAAAAVYTGKPQDAIQELLACVQEFPDSRQGWYLLGRYASGLGQIREAIQYYGRALALDSTLKTVYNELAYCYDALGEGESAVWAAGRYVELAPDEANPYDTQGEILARYGRLTEAIRAFERALEIDPNWYHSRSYLGYMYMFSGQYAKADSLFERLVFQSDPSLRNASRLYAVYPLLQRGKFNQALAELDKLVELYKSDATARAVSRVNCLARRLRAMILEEIGRHVEAIAEMQRCLSVPSGLIPADSALHLAYYVRLLEENGDHVQAELMIEERRRMLGNSGEHDRILLYMSALAALGRGKYDSAAHILDNDFLERDDFVGHVNLAQAYLGVGRLPEAETSLRGLANSYTSLRSYYGIESVKLHYYLGLVLEQMGRKDDAIEQYRVFTEIWSDAEPAPPSLVDARRRLDSLLRTP